MTLDQEKNLLKLVYYLACAWWVIGASIAVPVFLLAHSPWGLAAMTPAALLDATMIRQLMRVRRMERLQ